MHNGGILAFKVYPKAWEDDHRSSTERFDIPSPQIDSMPALNGDSPFKDDKNYSYVCTYQKAIDENPLTPTTDLRQTLCERVIDEIIATEHSYVKDLSQIITVS